MHLSTLLNLAALPLAFSFSHIGNLHAKDLSGRIDEMNTSLSGLNNGNTSLLKPNHFTFQAPGPDDRKSPFLIQSSLFSLTVLRSSVRSPCPAMNTLANHGFLPRNGRNITHQMLVSACKDGFNVGPLVPDTAFNLSIALNPEPGATVSYLVLDPNF